MEVVTYFSWDRFLATLGKENKLRRPYHAKRRGKENIEKVKTQGVSKGNVVLRGVLT